MTVCVVCLLMKVQRQVDRLEKELKTIKEKRRYKMRTVSVCKTFTFAAAHHLPHHEGLCAGLHGHNYRRDCRPFSLVGKKDSAISALAGDVKPSIS